MGHDRPDFYPDQRQDSQDHGQAEDPGLIGLPRLLPVVLVGKSYQELVDDIADQGYPLLPLVRVEDEEDESKGDQGFVPLVALAEVKADDQRQKRDQQVDKVLRVFIWLQIYHAWLTSLMTALMSTFPFWEIGRASW